MKAIPLIQKADVQSINTSIIALKEAQKELETLNIQVNRKISDLNKLLDGLDVSEIGGSGKLIQSIKQTDGKISATSVDLTSTIASGNNQPATSGGVADALLGKVNTATYTDINLNTLINIGFYKVAYSGNWQDYNFPVAHFGTVLVGTTSSGNLMQMFMSDDEQFVYVRNCTVNVWSSWKKVLNIDDVTNQVTSGDAHSVTSGGVYNALNSSLSWLLCSKWTEQIKFHSIITPAQMAGMVDGSPTWTLTYGKECVQMVNISWDDYQYHNAPAGAGGIFIPSYSSNGGTLILVDYLSTRFLFNVWIDSNRWSGWHYVDLASVVFS